METFIQLFGSLLSLVYHCFDRLVILAYLPLLTRAEHVVSRCCTIPVGSRTDPSPV